MIIQTGDILQFVIAYNGKTNKESCVYDELTWRWHAVGDKLFTCLFFEQNTYELSSYNYKLIVTDACGCLYRVATDHQPRLHKANGWLKAIKI